MIGEKTLYMNCDPKKSSRKKKRKLYTICPKRKRRREKKVEIKYRDTEDGFKQDEKLRWPWLFFPFFATLLYSAVDYQGRAILGETA